MNLKDEIGKIIGTAILKNDKNYTYDMVTLLERICLDVISPDDVDPNETLAYRQVKVYATHWATTRNGLRNEQRNKLAGLLEGEK